MVKSSSCLLYATSIVKNSDKEKWVYSDYRIALDGADSCNFGNNFPRNVVTFGVDNNSSSLTDNCKFVVLSGGLTYGINGSFGSPEKKFSINFTKPNTKCCLSLHYNHDNSYWFDNGRKN